MASWMMKTESIFKSFGSGDKELKVLKDISIEIEEGSLTILKGTSGSGKTTLLNIIGGLDNPTSGDVILEDKNLTKMKKKERESYQMGKISYIFQSVALLSKLTAYENVEIGLRIAGLKPKERDERAKHCLKLVGLSQRMYHFPHEMSGGEQQRVAVARALAIGSKLILADEPTAELDSHTGLKIIEIFKKLVEEEGVTVIMTTHDPDIMEFASRVYTLEDGVVVNE